MCDLLNRPLADIYCMCFAQYAYLWFLNSDREEGVRPTHHWSHLHYELDPFLPAVFVYLLGSKVHLNWKWWRTLEHKHCMLSLLSFHFLFPFPNPFPQSPTLSVSNAIPCGAHSLHSCTSNYGCERISHYRVLYALQCVHECVAFPILSTYK